MRVVITGARPGVATGANDHKLGHMITAYYADVGILVYHSEDLTLSVVDQSPLRKGGTGADALQESVLLAQVCEQLGYCRYWVAEHHNSASWTGVSPEIMIGQIAASTSTIRVGSGGVMLSHYSALKVAEQFRTLDAFYPGRIDLGIGRAPGSDRRTSSALAYPRPPAEIRTFPRQVHDLLDFLSGKLAEDHPFEGIKALAGPQPPTSPEVWLLGSSDFSARLAAMLGLPFAFADFFGNQAHGPLTAELYRNEFKPSVYLATPRLNVTVQVLCAPTEQEARYLSSSRNLNKLPQIRLDHRCEPSPAHANLHSGLLAPDEALALPLSDLERDAMADMASSYIDGDPEQVCRQIVTTANRYGTTNIGIVTNCFAFKDRTRSYELVARALNMSGRR